MVNNDVYKRTFVILPENIDFDRNQIYFYTHFQKDGTFQNPSYSIRRALKFSIRITEHYIEHY